MSPTCPRCGETRRTHRYDSGECHCAYCGFWFDVDDVTDQEEEE